MPSIKNATKLKVDKALLAAMEEIRTNVSKQHHIDWSPEMDWFVVNYWKRIPQRKFIQLFKEKFKRGCKDSMALRYKALMEIKNGSH